MRRSAFGVATLAVTIAACSLTTDLGGLSKGGPDEAGTSGSEAGDAPIAPGGGDGATPLPEGGAEGGLFDPCAGAMFCDRFERDVVDGVWSNVYTDNGGTLAIDSTTSTSPTRSLVMHVPATGNPHAQLASLDFPNVAHARVGFSMKCGTPNRNMALMRLQVDNADRGAVIDLFMLDGRLVLDENIFGNPTAGYADYTVATGFKPNTWQRWTMELDATGPTAVGIVTIDGAETLRTPLINSFPRGTARILMGAFYAPDGPVQDVSYDDVSLTILP